jgi:hypothetical protein
MVVMKMQKYKLYTSKRNPNEAIDVAASVI